MQFRPFVVGSTFLGLRITGSNARKHLLISFVYVPVRFFFLVYFRILCFRVLGFAGVVLFLFSVY